MQRHGTQQIKVDMTRSALKLCPFQKEVGRLTLPSLSQETAWQQSGEQPTSTEETGNVQLELGEAIHLIVFVDVYIQKDKNRQQMKGNL